MSLTAGARKESSTGFYHVIIRGNNRKYIFQDERFKLDYYEFLCDQETCGRIQLAAWCIMNNHVHIILKAEVENMSEAFKRINEKFAIRYNLITGSVGHVYDRRFISKPIETERYLMQSIRYVHNNPVKAKIVETPELYNWSSYKMYIKFARNLKREQMSHVMSYFKQDIDNFKKWHTKDDRSEHIDIKEDLDAFYLDRALHIYKNYHKAYGRGSSDVLQWNRKIADEMITEIIQYSHLPLRQIAGLIGVSYDRVRKVRLAFKSEI